MALVRSIELSLDRTRVPSNRRLMKEVHMVTMTTERALATVNHRPVARSEGLIRTPVDLPRVRFTRRGRMMVTGVSALLIGALSVGLATGAQATRARTGPARRYVVKVEVLPGQTLWGPWRRRMTLAPMPA
jgi:hypothetical protein